MRILLGKQLQPWILAARPKTLPASIVPVAIGLTLAAHDGTLHVLPAVVVVITAVLIQIVTNFANDVLDFEKGADSSERLGPVRATQAGLISARALKLATGALIGVCLLLGLYLVSIGGLPILVIGVLSLVFAVLYTAGPYALAYLGLGELFVLTFFGPVAVCGTQYLFSGTYTKLSVLAGLGCGLVSCAILAVNNLRDIDSDRISRKFTLAVRFGERFARYEYLVLLTAAAAVAVYGSFVSAHSRLWLTALYLLPGIPSIQSVLAATGREHAPALNQRLAATGKLLVLYGILFCVSSAL